MTAPPRGMAPPPPGQAPPPPATGAPPMSGMPPPGQAMAGGPPRFTPPGSGGPPPPPFGATSTPGAGHMPPPQTAPSGPRPPAMGAPPAAGQVSKPFSPSPPAPFVGGGSPSATPGVPTYSPPTIGGSHTGGHIPNAFAAGGPPSMAPPTPGPGAPMFAPPHGVGAPPISQMGPPPPKFGAPSATMQPSMAGGRPMSAMPAGAGSQAAVGALADSFQALMMEGGGQGGAGGMVDPNQFPRPLGGHPQGPPATAGSCSSRFIRFSTNALPNSAALANRWKLPLGASIHALAPGNPENDKDVPVVNFGQSGIVRCRKCRTYINPYAAFTEGGRRWRCNVCSLLNEVPVDYFCTLDAEGRRRDVLERPELCCGSVEFVAPAEYMVRPPMPPVYVFVVDVSFAAYSTGCVGPIIETIKQCLDELPGDERTQIGFLTYDTTLHFYNLKSTLSQPQMLVVTDLEDPFLPLPDELLANLRESRHVVDALLDSLAGIASQAQASETAVGPALQAAQLIMSHIGGKLLLFTSMLPSLGAGTLKQRKDEARLYGTDREHTLRNPEGDFYKKMAADCSRLQICVDVFAISQRPFIDIASLATLPKYTGGEVRFYPNFNEAADGAKLRAELRNNLVRETGWEAVMRVRCGKGLRVASFRGSFFIRSSDLLALPAVDCDKAITVEFGYDEQLLASTTAYLQCALLYTSSSGERRIRVHTVAVPICNDLGDLYRAADVGAAIACMSRLGVEKAMTGKLEEARSAITSMCGGVLREYRLLYAAQFRGTGSLVLPDALRLLPLYALGLVKSEAFRGGGREVSTDDRSAALAEVTNMSVEQLLDYAYPAMYSLHDMPQQVSAENAHAACLRHGKGWVHHQSVFAKRGLDWENVAMPRYSMSRNAAGGEGGRVKGMSVCGHDGHVWGCVRVASLCVVGLPAAACPVSSPFD
eukprot:jgi/Mesvir1/14196/Mv09651-RA.2